MKNNTLKKPLTLTIGIPTCYGGESLVETAESIYASTSIGKIQFIIVADRTPLTPKIQTRLKELGVSVTWNTKEGSQFKKLNQIVEEAKNGIFVFTQDDIMFERSTLSHILKAFEKDTKLTMLGIRVLPLKPYTFIESTLATMVRLVDTIGRSWNKGNNHLMASGRCLAFRTDAIKKFRIPNAVVNGDMFLYLENKRLGGKFAYSEQAKVFIRCPQTIKDQIGPSSRYQYSQQELKNYFKFEIKDEYKIPVLNILIGVTKEIMKNPLTTFAYFGVYIYTRIKKQPVSIASKTVWDVDESTKSVKILL